MGIAELFVLAVGLSMDAFAVSVCKGLSLGKITAKHMGIAGLWFGGFQALMAAVGYFLGSFFTYMITRYANWIAFGLLSFLGAGMVKEAFEKAEEMDGSMAPGPMFLLAVATSIDALAVGVTFAFLRVAVVPAVSFIGIVTFGFSAAGVKIGSVFGMKYKKKAEICGGVILILIGLKILLA
ncbi:MAG: manganese efflux pump MntP family protein [Lachnospiraceae bacterium]|nr:manganese efflux pump MntP family protein [Lachnospiraceae bacterium]